MSQAGQAGTSNIVGTGVTTINNLPPAGSGNFGIVGGGTVTVTPGINAITISSPAQIIAGQTGSATGPTITFSAVNCGDSWKFTGSGSTVTLTNTDARQSVFVGQGSGNITHTGLGNVCVGYFTMDKLTSGSFNTGIGYNALVNCTTGTSNCILGAYNNNALTTGSRNTAAGNYSLEFLLGGNDNISIGYQSGISYVGNESNNIAIGNYGTIGDNAVILIGDPSVHTSCYIAGILGAPAGTDYVTIDPITGQLGVTTPAPSGIVTIDGDTGSATGSTVTFNAQSNAGASWRFTGSGATVSLSNTDANYSVFIGSSAGNGTASGINNTSTGYASLLALTTGYYNVGFGSSSGTSVTTGYSNAYIGHASGNSNSTGFANTALGSFSFTNSLTGSYNISIGTSSAVNYSGSESSNLLINHAGVPSENNVIRIGTVGSGAAQQNACYIAGIYGVTVTGTTVICDANGKLGTVVSARRYKDNIKPLGCTTHNLRKLQPVSFNYKADPAETLHYGFIAEDVQPYFPELITFNEHGMVDSLKYHEMPAIIINEMHRLWEEVDALTARVSVLEAK